VDASVHAGHLDNDDDEFAPHALNARHLPAMFATFGQHALGMQLAMTEGMPLPEIPDHQKTLSRGKKQPQMVARSTCSESLCAPPPSSVLHWNASSPSRWESRTWQQWRYIHVLLSSDTQCRAGWSSPGAHNPHTHASSAPCLQK
jgi:hypothetical protein